MKKSMILFTFFLAVAGTETVLSQDQADKAEQVKARLKEAFSFVQTGNIEALAPYCVYRGSDKSRAWKDVFSWDDDNEKQAVMTIGGRIQEVLSASNDFEFAEFIVETESEGEWCVWRVDFSVAEKKRPVYFACLNINGLYAIGDIDD